LLVIVKSHPLQTAKKALVRGGIIELGRLTYQRGGQCLCGEVTRVAVVVITPETATVDALKYRQDCFNICIDYTAVVLHQVCINLLEP